MGKHRASWKRWVRDLEKKPKEPGGCCVFQMIFVLALTILAYNLYHWLWPDLRHHLLDKTDLAFTFYKDVEERGPIAYGKDEAQKLYIYRSGDAPEGESTPITPEATAEVPLATATGDFAETLKVDGHLVLNRLEFETGTSALGPGPFATLERLVAVVCLEVGVGQREQPSLGLWERYQERDAEKKVRGNGLDVT